MILGAFLIWTLGCLFVIGIEAWADREPLHRILYTSIVRFFIGLLLIEFVPRLVPEA